MMKICTRTAITILLLTLLWPAVVGHAASNLLKNASFENVTNGAPDDWSHDAYLMEEHITAYSLTDSDAHTGQYSAMLENREANHSRWTQTLSVKPKSIYKISGYVKTEGIGPDGAGALLYVDGVAVNYPEVRDTKGKWEHVYFYAKTGKEQKSIVIGASLGGYGSINTGKAYFDDLSVEKVSRAPAGAEVFSLMGTEQSGDTENAGNAGAVLPALLITALFCILFYIVYNKLLRDRSWLRDKHRFQKLPIMVALIAALVLRIAIAISNKGYANDIALFMSWANHAWTQGLSGFYHTGTFVDYPPGYIYILYLLGAVKSMLALDSSSKAALLLFKLPAILADLAAGYLIYRLSKKKTDAIFALGIAIIFLFNPAIIVDSAAWGQVDSIFALVLVLSIHGLSENKIERASVWFAIAALIKPQAFIFMPVLLLWFIYRRAWKQIPVSAFYGFTTFIVLALPYFWGNGGLSALIDLYKGTLSSYPYATLNAFNIYALSNANWKPITDTWLLFSFQTWGNFFIGAAVLLAIFFALAKGKGSDSNRSTYVAMVLIAVVFIGVTKMHERYMFPIILLAILAFIQSLDRRMLNVYLGFSITNFINMIYVLDYSKVSTNVPFNGIVLLCSTANIALMLYLLYLGYESYIRGRETPIIPILEANRIEADTRMLAEFKVEAVTRAKSEVKRLGRKDWIWMGGITLIYAVVALYQLGDMKGPETAWQPSASGEDFIIDLGEVKQLDRINSFGGVGTGKFKYEFSSDGTEWDHVMEIESSHVAVFKWNTQPAALQARYIKLSTIQTGFSMHELAIYEQGSKEPLPIIGINDREEASPKRGSISLLFDEQQLAVYESTFMDSSYFDEIYHARTAYEHLEHIVAYENTHPPLGKIIIALGIKLFGLNPFGWRIAGTLFGIAMLPLMYLFARRLFSSYVYAALATALFAADFMHFTQTRIATIDVYGVFFILLMFYFMHKYYTLSFYRVKLGATLVPLFLAGLFFGIGVASKWIVLYGGAGLAVMLGLSLFERYKQYAAAKRVLRNGGAQEQLFVREKLQQIIHVFPRYTTITILICLVFYIVIPIAIYALSYIPVLTVMSEGYTVKSLIDYQKHMFSYHSNLVSTHPFSSSWWEWPFMKRPVWYYSGDNLPAGLKSTIVAMGNPIIWWGGILAMLATIWISIKRSDKAIYTIWIAFLAQYIPWMLVTRLTFLYHYFAMVPFIILSLVYIFKVLEEKNAVYKRLRHAFLVVAILLFIMYYPALSGMTVQSWYVEHVLRWFPSWFF
ncbi:Gpi18-like mannosyltransferase/predicted membrane-bound dolichyl-phosphate-mannose-protein mannosyltransferase [Paenibacillus castaneae]|uniref:phospholipid carrier-dependent glycosyltransferase n=1 Tax=Paenibacillus castaneae TaxID=474957 RepID=UPI000C9CDE07|nr:phospholipid carrier-dependent glycosyltransferase [Paenibacillus castaneae]NIK76929.1 Gpi18-like mannosyltransferase/predicted membrane-bound dolichyl-phosphate-mannose-protein mannosyltransferase [Paenibacillus castaneae]